MRYVMSGPVLRMIEQSISKMTGPKFRGHEIRHTHVRLDSTLTTEAREMFEKATDEAFAALSDKVDALCKHVAALWVLTPPATCQAGSAPAPLNDPQPVDLTVRSSADETANQKTIDEMVSEMTGVMAGETFSVTRSFTVFEVSWKDRGNGLTYFVCKRKYEDAIKSAWEVTCLWTCDCCRKRKHASARKVIQPNGEEWCMSCDYCSVSY